MNYDAIVKKWQTRPITEIADIDIKLHNFRILFAYHSGKIENDKINYHDTREIFENGKVSNYTGDIRTLFEQQNQKDCYEMLKAPIVNREPLSIELIKRIHFELNKGTYDESRFAKGEKPGEFKKMIMFIFDENRKEYYQALQLFDAKEELKPLVSFLISQLEKTWNKR